MPKKGKKVTNESGQISKFVNFQKYSAPSQSKCPVPESKKSDGGNLLVYLK